MTPPFRGVTFAGHLVLNSPSVTICSAGCGRCERRSLVVAFIFRGSSLVVGKVGKPNRGAKRRYRVGLAPPLAQLRSVRKPFILILFSRSLL